MKKYLFFAAAITVMASCTSDTLVNGDSEYLVNGGDANQIVFSTSTAGQTRGDIAGSAAATLLGNNFYVTGTKGTEAATSPTPTLVFDNYLVHYGINTAGTTESNTANWEYVGVTPGTSPYEDYVKLAETASIQTIKYWDYSQPRYDFLAFSTGTYAAVSGSSTAATNIGVTAMSYGTNLAGSSVAYTFDLPSVDALKSTFITDITKVLKTNYGKEVTLKFKNLGAKVRMALYETVPGYSVKDVVFYTVDGTNNFTDANKSASAKLISANTNGIPTNGSIAVYFPHVGSNNASEADYDKASATVSSPGSGATYDTYQDFGALTAQLIGKDPAGYEANTNSYLGRSLPDATFAGSANADFYQTVFPVSSSDPLTLRVDYTLVSTDGSGETIDVHGAKAVVPSTYTKWLPNYAYTYIFKISDNTNGWTNPDGTNPAGLFPITFDAVVTEATDATGEQTTVTTVATPTITTYQQGHTYATDEYDKGGEKLYVQVMNNSTSPASLVSDLNGQTDELTNRSLLYLISRAATEAEVMDALQNRTTALTAANVTGRNGITLTNAAYITNNVTSIVNGVDDNPITVDAGTAAEIAIGSLTADKYYAYVYDYSDAAKATTIIYQPITVTVGTTVVDGKAYIANTDIAAWDDETTAAHYTSSSENAAAGYLYFSITTNGGASKTYSFISVDDKIDTALPDGLLKLPVDELGTESGTDVKAATGISYFDTYIRNTGKYAVKVIKVVD